MLGLIFFINTIDEVYCFAGDGLVYIAEIFHASNSRKIVAPVSPFGEHFYFVKGMPPDLPTSKKFIRDWFEGRICDDYLIRYPGDASNSFARIRKIFGEVKKTRRGCSHGTMAVVSFILASLDKNTCSVVFLLTEPFSFDKNCTEWLSPDPPFDFVYLGFDRKSKELITYHYMPG